jgi:hypothetical protein
VAKLAEAYIHLRPFAIEENTLNDLLDSISKRATDQASELYNFNVEIEIKAEEGSLRIWATIIGGGLFLYSHIADYKGFKDSIGELCKDAREFGSDICDYAINQSKANSRQIYRTERRLKTPGKMKRLISRIEKIEKITKPLESTSIQNEIDHIKIDINRIMDDLSQNERELLGEIIQKNSTVETEDSGKEIHIARHVIRRRDEDLPELFESEPSAQTPGGRLEKKKYVRRTTSSPRAQKRQRPQRLIE